MKLPLQKLRQFSKSRVSWGLLLLSALSLFVTALWFQHYQQLEPCLLCVYIRVAVLGVLVSSAIALMMPHYLGARLIGLVGWLISSGFGLRESLALIEKQAGTADFGLFGPTCDYIPNFPDWAPLHQWLPQFFLPNAQCGEDSWLLLGLTMAQWMAITFIVYLVIALLVLLSQPFRQPAANLAPR
ncbi:disulfide bond formation protein DsbB [Ferrimonas senticii]|uniref:disulfide bond formation protein DsbB n=1 Tax=Ferrimonas senticii TaxID=394566 RepID=UPI000420DC32|nr:disulfide bond formation protein DsbB [Ferrimonas senticii]